MEQCQIVLAFWGWGQRLVGYYVVFHARPQVYGKLPAKALESTTVVKGKTIYVYLVRLGHLFE